MCNKIKNGNVKLIKQIIIKMIISKTIVTNLLTETMSLCSNNIREKQRKHVIVMMLMLQVVFYLYN